MGVPHGVVCTQPAGIAQERCTQHTNKAGMRGWPRGNGPVAPPAPPEATVSPPSTPGLPDTPTPALPPSPPQPSPSITPVLVPPAAKHVEKIKEKSESKGVKASRLPPTSSVVRAGTAGDKDEIPAGAIILELRGYRDTGDADTEEKANPEAEVSEDSEKWNKELGDLYRNPTLKWLGDALPPESLEGMTPKEKVQTVLRTIHHNSTEGIMWQGLRYGLPPIVEGLGGMIGMDLENYGLGIDLAEQEFKQLILLFRIENEAWIDPMLTTQTKLLFLLANTAKTVHTINSSRRAALAALQTAPLRQTPPITAIAAASIPLNVTQTVLESKTASPPPVIVVGEAPSGVKIVSAVTPQVGGKNMGIRDALSAPIPPV